MKRLTILSALKETRKIWTELAKSGDTEKPEDVHYAFENGCPCCEYVCQKVTRERDFGMSCAGGDNDCEESVLALCPMKSFWPKGCCDNDSAYGMWLGCNSASHRRKYAAMIANAASRRIKALNKNQKAAK